jgi:DNA topoisomerase IB
MTNIDNCLRSSKTCITLATNYSLVLRYTIEEVFVALNQMSHLKAPGSDGFSVSFFQKHWVGLKVSRYD